MGLFSKFQKPDLSSEEEKVKLQYLNQFKNKTAKATPIRNIAFTVLDTETSGLNVKKDRLLSIAALKVQNFCIDIESSFEEIIFQEVYHVDESIKIHGILNKEVKTGTDEKEMLIKFLDYVGNDVIVGHHISFDVKMLNKSFKEHLGLKLKNRILDTATLASRVENPFPSNRRPISLDELCTKYHIPMGERHTAAADTFITAVVFLKMLGMLEKRGVATIDELL